MTAQEIRNTFLRFFESKQHQIVPSAPLVIKNDPTLMFTNAGMNQFKDIFLGNEPAKYPRVADTQKCLRVSGKHNDLEDVGLDTYHHTMFEMLGNWSFGDYFKKEAISWAWELLTEVYKLEKDRLYVTVFEGSKDDNLPFDQEAYDYWARLIDPSRIINGNKKDNFWEMGDTGPCGPCSEIHVDLRPAEERAKTDGRELVNASDPQVIEIWNLVFMEFNRMADGRLVPLPARHVDTGMGFERLVRALHGKSSNYDTDIFQPIISQVEKLTGIPYGQAEKTDIAYRVIADHIRTIIFAITDGQLPSNNGAGYVIRRILRRAVRYGYSYLNLREPFLNKLVHTVAGQFSDIFPEVSAQEAFIIKVITEEEQSFLRTLENGLKRIAEIMQRLNGAKVLDGKTVFELYDTYGFPVDLTALILREQGLSVDEAGFETELEKQKQRSREAATITTDDWVILTQGDTTEFIGYDQVKAKVHITRYRKVQAKGQELYQLVFDRTPFYAESGGQVGDTGYIQSEQERINIVDTRKENNLIIHLANKIPAVADVAFQAYVDEEKRRLTANNHSATHLLHAALKSVLGSHVAQKGSLVNAEYLRFDFSHFAKVTDEEIADIERMVNQRIRQNILLNEQRDVPIDQAMASGATALFGEKYGDRVRVITFDPAFSVELCGGTHVPATGQIGLFKITAETAVAAGVRRIEAVTADGAEAYINQQLALLNQVKENLNNPKDIVKALQQVQEEKARLQKANEAFEAQQTSLVKDELKKQIVDKGDVKFLAATASLDSGDAMKNLAFQLRNEVKGLIAVLGANINGKPQISVMIDEDLVKSHNLHAGNLVKQLAAEINGGGGGQPFYATAGGSKPEGLQAAVSKAEQLIFGG